MLHFILLKILLTFKNIGSKNRFVWSLLTNDQKYATDDGWVGPFLNRLGKWKMFQKLSRQQTYSAKINDQLCQHHSYLTRFSQRHKFKIWICGYLGACYLKLAISLSTGYSFWDRLRNFLLKFTWIVLSVHKLNKLGKFW